MQEYLASLERLRETDPELADDLNGIVTLEHVLGWMKRHDLALSSVEIIAQDEYSLDFVLPLPEGRFLVWGIT